MSFLSILIALLLEQVRPLAQLNAVHNRNRDWVRWVVLHFDAGQKQHGLWVWGLAVVLPSALACAVHWVLCYVGWGWALLWNVAVLYVTLGFRQFSHHFTQIRDALYAGDEALARAKLAQWMRIDASELPRSEIVRHVIVHSVLSAHRYVFAVTAWYAMLSALGLGPAGAVFYRVSEYLVRYVQRPLRPTSLPVSEALQRMVARAWYVVDWLPARMTALGFALVGSFEDAAQGWRLHAHQHPEDNDGLILAATAGAVGVRLSAHGQADSVWSEAQTSHLRAVVGLVWRTVVMGMGLLLLVGLAWLLG